MVGAFLDTTPKPPIINNSVFRSLPGATPTETKALIQSLKSVNPGLATKCERQGYNKPNKTKTL